jgi:hypothetical protein
MSIPWTITFDCHEPAGLASFWKLALGYVDAPPPKDFDSWDAWFQACEVPLDERDDGASLVDPDGARPSISFLKVPEGKAAKNRVHLDVQVGGGRAQQWETRWARISTMVESLAAAGGTVVQEYEIGDRPDHVVMLDPEGNEFCVV